MTAAPIGMGAMRLSTERDRDDNRATSVLHAALDSGVTFIDTADAYCWDSSESGHNERLIARALATWGGDRSRILVATKGGLTRPNGLWVPDGRAKHLAAACDASRRALGVDRIPLYQLHAPDPRVPLSTSVRALGVLARDGLIEAIGLCNVSVAQLEEARAIADIAAVQVELSLWHDDSIMSSVVDYCLTHGIKVLAHRPLGGPQRRRQILSSAVLASLAERHGATPFEIALAWLHSLSPLVIPLPGATHVETTQSVVRAATIALTPDDCDQLEDAFPAPRAVRVRRVARGSAAVRQSGEIVLIMGLPGAGKTTLAQTLVAEGYERLNRDEVGGTLSALLPVLDRLIADGHTRIVLDNTYATRKARAGVLHAAWTHGFGVRCIWLTTGLEDAQINAVQRMISRHGRLLMPEEMRKASKRDVSAFGPAVQFRYQRELEPPDASEGFASILRVPFARAVDPSRVNRALIVWCDGILLRSRSDQRFPVSVGDVDVFERHGEIVRRYEADGWRILGLSWRPEIADGTTSAVEVDRVFARMRELLGVAIDVEYCPHGAGPPTCWCRKPLPGLGVLLIHRHRVDPARSLYVGHGPHDAAFARRLTLPYHDAAEVFR
jgi:aryl-alcohol dehydrogenase-like predicted oxidoreductase/histidinol phosphatase-like enzyme/predicted kinase